jgi:hypothetical protein
MEMDYEQWKRNGKCNGNGSNGRVHRSASAMDLVMFRFRLDDKLQLTSSKLCLKSSFRFSLLVLFSAI